MRQPLHDDTSISSTSEPYVTKTEQLSIEI